LTKKQIDKLFELAYQKRYKLVCEKMTITKWIFFVIWAYNL